MFVKQIFSNSAKFEHKKSRSRWPK